MAACEKPRLVIERHFKAPAEKVFAAWTTAETLMRWFHPGAAMRTPLATVDLRVGGRYRIVMLEPDGAEHRVGGTYREIVPNRRLVFTWAWESAPERETLVTVALEPIDGGTTLTLTHEQFADAGARDHHQQGWVGCLDSLERSIA